MGFNTIGIARGRDKEPHARRLGAAGYSDSQGQDPAAELQRLGGAAVILATATSGEAMGGVQGGLAINGTLLIVGAADLREVGSGIPFSNATVRLRTPRATILPRAPTQFTPLSLASARF